MTPSLRMLILTVTVAFTLMSPLSAHAGLQALNQLFVFGDSLSDGGNYAGPGGPGTYPPPPYAATRYSDGPTAVEYLWQAYHPGDTSFKPSSLGGTNYALGGATSGSSNFNAINHSTPPGLQGWFDSQGGVASQVSSFTGNCTNCFVPDESLFVVWAFPNDVFSNALWGLDAKSLIKAGVDNITNAIQQLASVGASHFLVPNMPDLGNTPGGAVDKAILTPLTLAFNAALAEALSLLEKSMKQVEITPFDTFATLNDVINNQDNYGMKNVTDQCVQHLTDPKNPCNPDTWLFWDSVHPTTAGHAILGTQFAAALDVPEPGSLQLMALALMLLALSWRARQRSMGAQAAWLLKPLPATA